MAALVGGYSRPLALGTGRGIVFLAILLGIGDLSRDPARVLALMAAGALWTACLALAFGSLFRALAGRPAAATPATPTASALQKFRRWRRMLRQPEGWQYTLRLTGCLAVAALLRTTWPDHHFGWIAVTVAILCQRQPEALPLRVTQRAVGAALGVGLAGLVALPTLPGWLPAGLIALLGGLGPWLRGRNYLAYTASMTPLIILLFSGGRPAGTGPLVDRLLATAIGAALVVGANALLLRAAPVPPPNNLASRRQG
ncbi:FUSC family protein [Rhodovastum atsumiense]|uniref:FUSC family protein n=2 Tax=Rhodovastum atsumiense TaxID=504468 RepID=A0A5M6ILU2_9PROT|nr:FUSC family protein [Rhodovastum atsumiense]